LPISPRPYPLYPYSIRPKITKKFVLKILILNSGQIYFKYLK